jgi:hypothetical protein
MLQQQSVTVHCTAVSKLHHCSARLHQQARGVTVTADYMDDMCLALAQQQVELVPSPQQLGTPADVHAAYRTGSP